MKVQNIVEGFLSGKLNLDRGKELLSNATDRKVLATFTVRKDVEAGFGVKVGVKIGDNILSLNSEDQETLLESFVNQVLKPTAAKREARVQALKDVEHDKLTSLLDYVAQEKPQVGVWVKSLDLSTYSEKTYRKVWVTTKQWTPPTLNKVLKDLFD